MNNKLNSKIFLGTMSGTSLDGLDLCAVEFNENTFRILSAITYEYSESMRNTLAKAHLLLGLELMQLHVDYGIYCGNKILEFIQTQNLHIDYIASHGHTVFHTPQKGLTFQIGSGAHISAQTNVPVINDFRTLDVAWGGQGAPLVPIGDEYLFSEYTYCLNIGGFANVSLNSNGKRLAWDICPVNIIINEFAKYFGVPFDKNGDIARKGKVDTGLLYALNSIDFYSQKPPKSLGREWVESEVLPILDNCNVSKIDSMRTVYEHCAYQIGKTLSLKNSTTLCTGGGTYNVFLIELIKKYSNSEIIIPEPFIVEYKEALLFAYLGYLKISNKVNSLASVTGAIKDISGGIIWNT